MVQRCKEHKLLNCMECIPNGGIYTSEWYCAKRGVTLHMSSFQGMVGKFLNRLPETVWDWSDSSAKNCDKQLRTFEKNMGE